MSVLLYVMASTTDVLNNAVPADFQFKHLRQSEMIKQFVFIKLTVVTTYSM